MGNWQHDLLNLVGGASNEQEIFEKIIAAARELGFEYCSYGLRPPLPLSNPRVVTLFEYPRAWTERYHAAGYVNSDPSVLHGRRTQTPVVWSDGLFAATPQLWAEARSFGIRIGWAQSCLDVHGVGMLTLARSSEPLTEEELAAKESHMRWLVQLAHLTLTGALAQKEAQDIQLTERETDVLKWTADGKTASDIAKILSISVNTVNFHVRNAMAKLGAVNKTSAVVKAAVLGRLN